MEKRFNIYSQGVLILKDDTLMEFKESLQKKQIKSELDKLKASEMFIYFDPETGRQWEYERVM